MADLAGISDGELRSALTAAIYLAGHPQVTGDDFAGQLRQLAHDVRDELETRPRTGLLMYLPEVGA